MNNNSSDTPSTSDEFLGPTANSLNQLAGQLTQWRGMLPSDLQWPEDDPSSFPSPQSVGGHSQSLYPNLSQQKGKSEPLFSTDLGKDPTQYPYVYDIHVALLRTRYYYAKYMVYRPFIYKALHFPEQMLQDDAEGVAECLRVRIVLSHCLGIIKKLTTQLGMLEMASCTLSNISSQKTCALSLLLVTKLSLHSADIPLDTS